MQITSVLQGVFYKKSIRLKKMQQDLKYIYQVYQDKNFSKAAEKLYITRPALSMAIKKIEYQIGIPLFYHSTRPLQLTAAGEAYII